jgi:hypothetical protein
VPQHHARGTALQNMGFNAKGYLIALRTLHHQVAQQRLAASLSLCGAVYCEATRLWSLRCWQFTGSRSRYPEAKTWVCSFDGMSVRAVGISGCKAGPNCIPSVSCECNSLVKVLQYWEGTLSGRCTLLGAT